MPFVLWASVPLCVKRAEGLVGELGSKVPSLSKHLVLGHSVTSRVLQGTSRPPSHSSLMPDSLFHTLSPPSTLFSSLYLFSLVPFAFIIEFLKCPQR